MAVCIKKELLSTEDKEQIRNDLTLKYNLTYMQRKMKMTPKPPIMFFVHDEENVYVPFKYGCDINEEFVNDSITRDKISFKFTGNLRDYQTTIIDTAIEHLLKYRTTTLSAYTGAGKSACSAMLSSVIWNYEHVNLDDDTSDGCIEPTEGVNQEMVLVIHPRNLLNKSWKSTFDQFTTATSWIVNDRKPPKVRPDVIICVDGSIHKIPKEWIENIGFLILDEAHMLCSVSRVPALLKTTPKYVLSLSATLEREEDGMHKMIHLICGEHIIIRRSNRPFTVLKVLTGIEPTIKQGPHGTDWKTLVDSLTTNEKRNNLIISLICNYLEEGWKIMVMTNRVKHAEELNDMLEGETFGKEKTKIKHDYLAGTKSDYSDSHVLVMSAQKGSTGFDEAMACSDFQGVKSDMILYCMSSKNTAALTQAFGRTRADAPCVVYLLDDNPILTRHWKVAEKFFKSLNSKIIEQTIDDEFDEES